MYVFLIFFFFIVVGIRIFVRSPIQCLRIFTYFLSTFIGKILIKLKICHGYK